MNGLWTQQSAAITDPPMPQPAILWLLNGYYLAGEWTVVLIPLVHAGCLHQAPLTAECTVSSVITQYSTQTFAISATGTGTLTSNHCFTES